MSTAHCDICGMDWKHHTGTCVGGGSAQTPQSKQITPKKETDTMIDFKAIQAEVKANMAKLDGCARHEFDIPIDRRTKKPIAPPPGPSKLFFCEWECIHCGGQVGGREKGWYERGIKHARAGGWEPI